MPRSDKKTKQEILETATRLFAEKGLENVNVEDVVKELGVTRGAFYHYFKSREELISGVMYKSFNDNNPFVLANRQKELNALEKLRFVFKLDLTPRLDMSDIRMYVLPIIALILCVVNRLQGKGYKYICFILTN